MIIGLTGGTGSGKSFVCRTLREVGWEVIDADQIYKELTEPGKPLLKELEVEFGDILTEGQLDREKLSKKALGNPKLNEITHRAISKEIDKRIGESTNSHIVLDLPLLFESGYDKRCDEVWVVVAKLEDRIARIIHRDGISEEEILRRIKFQTSDEEKIAKADVVLYNYGTKDELLEKVKGLIDGRS